jgi:C1A family cysteine protease
MRLSRWAFFLLLASINVGAESVKITGTLEQTIPITDYSLRGSAESRVKEVTLLKVELSDAAQEQIKNKLSNHHEQAKQQFSVQKLTSKIQLGMSDVPVLDQGRHGSCVTFAATAAIDAALNNNSNISQLCLLQLGNFLEKNAHIPSGWDGSNPLAVLDEIAIFGVINKKQQTVNGCGGLTEYPTQDSNTPSTEMSPYEYHQLSTSVSKEVGWSSVIDQYTLEDNPSAKKTIQDVKTVLSAKDRLVLGIILVDINLGTNGAVGKFHTKMANDSWVLSSKIEKDTLDFIDGTNPGLQYGLHAMIVTGYDDYAVAIDDQGVKHKGLFTLRNSWGKEAGDHGEYYMSYDYFATFAIDALRIRKS